MCVNGWTVGETLSRSERGQSFAGRALCHFQGLVSFPTSISTPGPSKFSFSSSFIRTLSNLLVTTPKKLSTLYTFWWSPLPSPILDLCPVSTISFPHNASSIFPMLWRFFPTLDFQVHYFNFYRTRVRSLVMLVSDSLPNWLTHSCLVNLIDVTLACEDANSKLVEVCYCC